MSFSKLHDNLILIFFIVIIFVPNIVFFAVKDKLPKDNTENRELMKFPIINKYNIDKFPIFFDAYWSDNLPFRELIQSFWMNLNYDILKISTNEKIVIGKKDEDNKTWLYFSKDSQPLEDIMGIKQFDGDTMEKIKIEIEHDTNEFTKRGIKFYYAIAPNKSTIKTKYLPDGINIAEQTRTEKLYQYLKENNIKNYIYLKEPLEEADKIRNTYLRLDSHWNSYGAFIGTKEIYEMINGKSTIFDGISFKRKEHQGGDLYKMLKIHIDDMDYDFETENFFADKDGIKNVEDKLIIFENNQNEKNETLLIVGDSYSLKTLEYFGKIYKKIVRVHPKDYKAEMLEEYNPDVVLVIRVERSADEFSYYNSWFKK